MLKLLGAIAAVAVFTAGCGGDPAPSAATAATTPAPTPTPSAETEADHPFEKGHSRAVRDYYGSAHSHPGDNIEAEYHQPPRPATGGIGDTITLTGSNIGVRLRVTLTGLIDSVRTTESPRAGMRYVGVNLRLKSTGITIHDDVLEDALLRYGGGKARPVMGVKAACSNGFQGVVRIDVGHRARGCVLFRVPASARPRQFQLALEQVPAEAGGRWRLR